MTPPDEFLFDPTIPNPFDLLEEGMAGNIAVLLSPTQAAQLVLNWKAVIEEKNRVVRENYVLFTLRNSPAPSSPPQ